MAGQADGSIIIDTEMSSEGFEAGSKELLGAIKALSQEVKNLGALLKDVFNTTIAPKVDTSEADKQIDNLETKVKSLEGTVDGTRSINPSGLQRQIESVETSIKRLEPAAQKAAGGSESAMASFGNRADVLEEKITKLQAQLDAMGRTQFPTQEYSDLTREIEKTDAALLRMFDKQDKLSETGVSENSRQWQTLQYDIAAAEEKLEHLKATQEAMEANGRAFTLGANTAQYDQMAATLERAKQSLAEMRSSAGKTHSTFGNIVKKIAGGLVNGIKGAVKGMGKLIFGGKDAKSQFSGLISSVKKFSLSLMGARGVYALLRKAVSAYMSENQDLSKQLNAVWSGIGNLLGPLITRLINLVSTAVAYVTKFFGSLNLFGKTANTNMNKAAGSAKKLQKATAGFDELNILGSKDEGGDGGTGKLPDVELPDWLSDIGEMLKNGQLIDAAKGITSAFNGFINGIDWEGGASKIASFIDGGLSFLATFVTTVDWNNLGKKLGAAITKILTGVNWKNLGVILGAKLKILLDLIGGLFKTIDWKAAGKGLSDATIGLLGTINEALDDFDWKSIGEDIADFLNSIDWAEIFRQCATLLGHLLVGAFDLLGGFLGEIDWAKLADDIFALLDSLVNDIDWESLGSSIGTFLSNTIKGIFTFLGRLVTECDWGQLLQDLIGNLGTFLVEMVKDIDWIGILGALSEVLVGIIVQIPGIIAGAIGGICDLLAAIFEGLGLDGIAGFFKGIGDAMRDVGAWLKKNLVDPVVGWVKDLFGIHSPSTVFSDIGDNLIGGLFGGISESWGQITSFFSEKLGALKESISNTWNSIKEKASTAWDNIKSTVSEKWEGMKESASTWGADVCSGISNGIQDGVKWVSNAATDVANGIKSLLGFSEPEKGPLSDFSTYMPDMIKLMIQGINDGKAQIVVAMTGIADVMASVTDGMQDQMVDTFASLKNAAGTWGRDLCSNMANGIRNGISTVSSAVSGVANSIKSLLGFSEPEKGPLSDFSTYMPDMVKLMVQGINDGKAQIIKAAAGIAQALAESIGSGQFALRLEASLSNFSDRVANSFAALVDRLQNLAGSFSFAVPTAAGYAVPYAIAAQATGASQSMPPILDPAGLESILVSMADQLGATVNGFEVLRSEVRALRGDVQSIEVGDEVIGRANARYVQRRTIMMGGAV